MNVMNFEIDEIPEIKNRQYLKYKDKFKRQCVVKTVSGACLIVGLIFLLFLPIFQIKNEILGVVLYKEEFSFYEEIKVAFGLMVNYTEKVNGSNGLESVVNIFGVYQLVAVVFIAAGTIWLAIDAIRELAALAASENYAVMQYDKIKTRSTGKSRGFLFGWRRYSPSGLILSGVVFEILYILMVRIVLSNTGGADVGLDYDGVSKFVNITGVTGLIVFPSLFFAGYFIGAAYNKIVFSKIKTEIIKEDYNIK